MEYVDQERHPFNDLESSILWEWIGDHMQICRYSLDIRKCKNNKCCSKYRALDATILLNENNGFLPLTTKGKDGHFINPIHALQYHDNSKFQSTIAVALQFHENYISVYVVAYVANIFRSSSS